MRIGIKKCEIYSDLINPNTDLREKKGQRKERPLNS